MIFNYQTFTRILCSNEPLRNLWAQTSTRQLAVVIDAQENSTVAAGAILDVADVAQQRGITFRRARPTALIVQSLNVRALPAILLFERSQPDVPVFVTEFAWTFFDHFIQFFL